MVLSALIGAGAALLSSRNTSRAVENATDAQVGASQQQIDLYRQIYQDQIARNEPFRQGELARSQLYNEVYGIPAAQQAQASPFAIATSPPPPQTQPQVPTFAGGGLAGAAQLINRSRAQPQASPTPPPAQAYGFPTPTATPTLPSMDPMQRFYQSPFGQVFTDNFNRDRDTIDSGLASQGLAFSGARMQSVEDARARNFGNAFNSYMAGLAGSPSMQASRSADLAGTSFGGRAGGALSNIGTAQAQGAYGRAESQNNLLNAFGRLVGEYL